MAKFSRVSLSRKKALEQPDEFLTASSRLLQLAVEYKRHLYVAVSVFFAVVFIIVGARYYSENAENKASALLSEAIITYRSSLGKSGPEGSYTAAEKEFQSIRDHYSRTVSGKLAGIHLANICFDAGDYKKALTLFEDALSDFGKHPSYRNIVLNGLAYSHEALNDTAAAVKYFKMITDGENTVMKDNALFQLGRLYSETGEEKKSAEAFETLVSDFPDSIYIELAREKVPG